MHRSITRRLYGSFHLDFATPQDNIYTTHIRFPSDADGTEGVWKRVSFSLDDVTLEDGRSLRGMHMMTVTRAVIGFYYFDADINECQDGTLRATNIKITEIDAHATYGADPS
jgi:hypothetical protein